MPPTLTRPDLRTSNCVEEMRTHPMQCPHCAIRIHDAWRGQGMVYETGRAPTWHYRMVRCPECDKDTVEICDIDPQSPVANRWLRAYPTGSNRGPVPSEVPGHIAQNYTESCNVLPISAKASAAMSRRCLQNILHDHGYKAGSLATEIDLLLNEKDATKAIPTALRITIDGIRNFGNFSAHPITDVTTLQVIDVEPEEAEQCLEIIEEMFDHFYVRPERARLRKAALDAKLAAAGKPPSK